jgi:hypothetical protein
MGHGLTVAFFAMTTVVAAGTFWRLRIPVLWLPPAAITAYLSVILVLCKSLGSLVYGIVLIPLVRFATPRFQFGVATVLVSVALLYPMLRVADLFPTQLLVYSAESISTERGVSLKFRFNNEDRLLVHASDRIFFGWGRWGRSRLYDVGTGEDISVTDGAWIITIGQFGLFGFVAQFGLLAFPVFRAASSLKFVHKVHQRAILGTLALIVSINITDSLPNSSVTPWTWLLAGALLGTAECLRTSAQQASTFRSYSSISSLANRPSRAHLSSSPR